MYMYDEDVGETLSVKCTNPGDINEPPQSLLT